MSDIPDADLVTYRDQCLRELVNALGCGDSSCAFRTTMGMHTNGGCRCFKALPSPLHHLTSRFVRASMKLAGIPRQGPR